MIYEIVNGQVFKLNEVKTPAQTVITKESLGFDKKIIVDAENVEAGLNSSVEISFTWYRFNPDIGSWTQDPSNSENILLDIDGETQTLQPVNGSDTLIFSSSEPGPVTIQTVNPLCENVKLGVFIHA